MSDPREAVFRRLLATMPVVHHAAETGSDDQRPVKASDAVDALQFDFPQLSQRQVDVLATHWLTDIKSLEQRQARLPLSPQLLERVDFVSATCNVDALRSALLLHALPDLLRMQPLQASRVLSAFVQPASARAAPESSLDRPAAPAAEAIVELVAAEQDGDDYVFEEYSDSEGSGSGAAGDDVVAAAPDSDALARWPERLRHFTQHLTYERFANAWDADACKATFDVLSLLLDGGGSVDDAWLDVVLPRLCFVVRDRCLQRHTGEELPRLLKLLLDAPQRGLAVAERCAHLAIATMTSMTSVREASVARHAFERLSFLAARAAVPNLHPTQLTSLSRIVVHGVALDERVGAALLPSRFVHTYLRFFLDTIRAGGTDAALQLTLRGAWPRADADDLEAEALLLIAAHVPKVLEFLMAVPDFVAAVSSPAFSKAHAPWFGAWTTLCVWHAVRARKTPDALLGTLDKAVLAPLTADEPVAAARVIEWQSVLLRIAHEQSHGTVALWATPTVKAAARLQPQLASRLSAAGDDERARGNVLRLQRALKAVPRDSAEGSKKD
jgi:hypothetical protein